MLKLYGFAVSNYFNMVKHALLEKGVEFEEITVFPDQNDDYLAKSPMGKVPCIETEQGYLSETSVILEYLDAAYPETPLLPEGDWERAKTRELMKISELYIELAGRRLLPEVIAGIPVDDETKKDVWLTMKKGLASVDRLAVLEPYAMGDSFTLADIVLRYSMAVAKMAGGAVLKRDVLEGHEALRRWDARMSETPICQQLDADMQAQMDAFLKKMQAG